MDTHRRGLVGPTVEVLTLRGLGTCYVLFVLDLASRTVKIAGITPHPHDAWMTQMARNLTDAEEPFLRHTRFLIMDRDTKYSAIFRAALTRERIEPIRGYQVSAPAESRLLILQLLQRPSAKEAFWRLLKQLPE